VNREGQQHVPEYRPRYGVSRRESKKSYVIQSHRALALGESGHFASPPSQTPHHFRRFNIQDINIVLRNVGSRLEPTLSAVSPESDSARSPPHHSGAAQSSSQHRLLNNGDIPYC
jgi:hypothetical protein